MTLEQIIITAREQGASDIHISAGLPLMFRINGQLTVRTEFAMSEEETKRMLLGILNEKQKTELENGRDADFALVISGGKRQRVNVFCQQRKICATIRILNNDIPGLDELGLPKVLDKLAEEPRGLILFTGPTGSGKSTSMAAVIEKINQERAEHILTVEDPVEYVFEQKKSLIHQREVGADVESFASALRSALREDPDIILVGEMRDYETISAALTAAETGHLVMSTLHTTGAAQTIDRIIDACPTGSQNQVRTQLAGVLQAVITQCLMPNRTRTVRVVATEVLLGTDAAANLIRENKCHQIGTLMQSGAALGMHTLNGDLARLLNAGKITKETAMKYSNDKNDLKQYLY